MFQRFFPNEYYDSTYHIDFQAFYDKGYRAVLFDVDIYGVKERLDVVRIIRERVEYNKKRKGIYEITNR